MLRRGAQQPELPVNLQADLDGCQLRSLAEGRAILLEEEGHLQEGLATLRAEGIHDLNGLTNDEFEQELQRAETTHYASTMRIGREVARQQHALRLEGMEGDLARLLP